MKTRQRRSSARPRASKAPPREVTKRTLQAKELTEVPGTFGDALRADRSAARSRHAPDGEAQPLIRDSNFQDSQVFFDGAPVPILYHFGNFEKLRQFATSRARRLLPRQFLSAVWAASAV